MVVDLPPSFFIDTAHIGDIVGHILSGQRSNLNDIRSNLNWGKLIMEEAKAFTHM